MNTQLIKSLAKLKNASILKKKSTLLFYNQLTLNIIKILYKEGLIQSYNYEIDSKTNTICLKVFLRYNNNKSMLNNIKLMSKSTKHVYLSLNELSFIKERYSLLILSTTKGLLTSLECKQKKLGGKLLVIC